MFDIKLNDGRYFKNISIWDCYMEVWLEQVETILDNSDYKMKIYHYNDDECEQILAEVTSNDIEYVCEAYRYSK